VSPFRSVGARLSVALALVVAIALGIVYAAVVPLLERNLVQARSDDLATSALLARQAFDPSDLQPGLLIELQDYVENAAFTTNSRVAVLTPLSDGVARVIADSRQSDSSADLQRDAVALRAALGLIDVRDTVSREGERFAEIAFALDYSGAVLLFSAPLGDTLANVDLVRRRVLVSGGIALVIALILGYGGASLFARRIRRLERAADRIAGGRLDEPVVDHGRDEVGQLARAFERMRLRLGQAEGARREFIANASHELRTPLFSLGGFLELLMHEPLDEPTRREFLGTMQEQVERLQRLATDLLDLSRLDAGRLATEREPLDLPHLAAVLREEFGGVARATGRRLGVRVEGEPPQALGDEPRVLQIGRVLVANAFRHTDAAAPIEVRVSAAPGGVEMTVLDEGDGIPVEHQEQVFERFYRLEGTHASGSGLGLAIARELAEVMGGTLTLVSRPGRTAFTLGLPAAPVPGRTARREAAAASSG